MIGDVVAVEDARLELAAVDLDGERTGVAVAEPGRVPVVGVERLEEVEEATTLDYGIITNRA